MAGAYSVKAYKFEAVVIRLAVDENEIRLDVAIAVIIPFPGKWVVYLTSRIQTSQQFVWLAGLN